MRPAQAGASREIRYYLSEGLRRDEAYFGAGPTARLLEALRKRGVAEDVLAQAVRDLAA